MNLKIKHFEIKHFKGLESISIQNCGNINAFIGKNNAGKSSILHAIDIAGLAMSIRSWDYFQPKLEIKDLFSAIGRFELTITYQNDTKITLRSNELFNPFFSPEPNEQQRFKSVLIYPDAGTGLLRREHKTPQGVLRWLNERNYQHINSLDILYAIKFYSGRNENGFTPETYSSLVDEITYYFPDLKNIKSDRTEQDIATLTYEEYGKTLDILYSGTGLKHFLDVLLKTTISKSGVVLLDEPELGLHPDLQRRFFEYLNRLSIDKNIQFFLATHSQVLLNYAESINCYRVINKKGRRDLIQIPQDSIHVLLGDLGIKPSDIFNQDICLLVEGASEVIFFEHVIRNLYKDEFNNIAIAVQQYGGSAAEGIVNRTIDISNITTIQKYSFWIHDRDAKPNEVPSTTASKFCKRLEELGVSTHILKKREIEFYFPDVVLVAAQQGNELKEGAALEILNGDQSLKFTVAAETAQLCVPKGKFLKKLLCNHLNSKEQLDAEITEIIEKLISWKKEILGQE